MIDLGFDATFVLCRHVTYGTTKQRLENMCTTKVLNNTPCAKVPTMKTDRFETVYKRTPSSKAHNARVAHTDIIPSFSEKPTLITGEDSTIRTWEKPRMHSSERR
jgi:hypothetical protein